MTVVRDQLFPQKPPGSRFRFSRTGVQPSPGLSTIELPSAFAESGAYPPDREPPGSPRQCSLPLACRHPPEGHQIGARKRRTPENTILSQPYCRRVSTDRSDREGSQLAASLEGEPGPTPAGKTLPHSYPETRFRRERARECKKGVKSNNVRRTAATHIITTTSYRTTTDSDIYYILYFILNTVFKNQLLHRDGRLPVRRRCSTHYVAAILE